MQICDFPFIELRIQYPDCGFQLIQINKLNMQIADEQQDVQHSIPDLDNVNIKLGDDEKKVNQISSNTVSQVQQPQQVAIQMQPLPQKAADPSFLSQLFHCLFKGLAIFVFFIPEGLLNLTYCFIVVVILSAIDFWTVKNITGRQKLVGLRWWSEVKEDGSEEWIYESQVANFIPNPFNSNVFWFAQFGVVLTWGILILLDLIGLRWFNAVLAMTAFCLTGINFVGFYKCRGEHQKKAKEYMTKIGLKAIQQW
ncbi:unnamed protein product (macronuclear) [Paramecium tetraurelia]|uniref:Golgi apparatus membrane protein TVP23 homolog n=1 Tax=Paramecium tetraurelia TaxID=5888 RepID=A0DHE0_PARTE|nr:uncharacterized protein GSPATT00016844001 [Paramecium tetraurelia]CAK82457.1 unnamed protein product [Paramecium tetraurelia]|eukprot:XP_001449854.1 hypothetical protein (macronuclear) [Paramecium tetraurelia strain d4-2]